MQEYLIILLLTSLVLLVIFLLLRKSIPLLSTRTIYGTVAISLTLGAIFPAALSNLTTGKVLGIYLGLTVFSATILSYFENRFFLKANTVPVKGAASESDLPLAAPDVASEPGDAAGNNQLESGGDSPELYPPVEFAQPVAEDASHPPVALTAQPDLPVDITRDIDLPRAAPDILPEFDLPPAAPDTMSEPDTQSAGPDVTPESEDGAGNETDEPDYNGQLAASPEENPDQENNADMGLEDSAVPINDGMVNDYISAGFQAKARGDMDAAADYFFKAFRLYQGQQLSIALAMEIAAVYQELGQYFQAKMIIESVLGQEGLIPDFSLKQKLKKQIIYLDTLVGLLRMAKMSNAPYSKVPNLIKMKANIETSVKLANLTMEAG